MANPIQLIVGLGNPGPRYQKTRHNVGFWWLDALAAAHHVCFRTHHRFQAELAEITVAGSVCRLLKPMTFMNLSGQAVQACSHFYKLPAEAILVVHDELDLPCGSTQLKWNGAPAGHNGLKDIQLRLATKAYWRLRIGIDHPRHHHGQAVADYVLEAPDKHQQALIEASVQRSLTAVPQLLQGQLSQAQQSLNT